MFVLPWERGFRARHRPYLVIGLVAANMGVFLVTLFGSKQDIMHQYGFISSASSAKTVLTSMFLHAGFLHLLGNMIFLFMFGDNVEDVVGPLNLAAAYLAAGVAATLAFACFNSRDTVPLVGASGAISGIAGMYLAFFPKKPFDLCVYVLSLRVKEFSVTAKTATLVWFAEQLVLGLGAKALGLEEYVRTAFIAHAAGFVAGAVIGAGFVGLGFIRRYDAEARRHPLLGYVT